MAKQTIIRHVDDLDGGDAACTINFALDGTEYSIDLSDKNATRFRAALYPFMVGGRRDKPTTVNRPVRSAATRTLADREAIAAVRKWATSNGYKVAPMGRISAVVMEAYRAAQAGRTSGPRAGR